MGDLDADTIEPLRRPRPARHARKIQARPFAHLAAERAEPEAMGTKPLPITRRARAAALLVVVADSARLYVLEQLSESARARIEFDADTLRPLEVAGLIQGQSVLGLSTTGREVWQSVRGLVR